MVSFVCVHNQDAQWHAQSQAGAQVVGNLLEIPIFVKDKKNR